MLQEPTDEDLLKVKKQFNSAYGLSDKIPMDDVNRRKSHLEKNFSL